MVFVGIAFPFKLFLRENDETPSLLWALVGGLTWIRK
jgi:hypothetical protein